MFEIPYYRREALKIRKRLETALAKPLPESDDVYDYQFNPWCDVIQGIDGSYASCSDALMIEALEAVRDQKTFDFIDRAGFAGEFALYVLSGQGLTDYGTSPRGGFPKHEIRDLWQPLIEKWRAHYEIVWDEPVERIDGKST
jgi:hypothetical protein